MFVFPCGIRLSRTKPEDFKHLFVLTVDGGLRLYGFCITMFVPVTTNVVSIVRMEIANNFMFSSTPAQLNPDNLPKNLYTPRTICILSSYSLHDAFFLSLRRLTKHSRQFDQDLTQKIWEVLSAEEAIVCSPYWVKDRTTPRTKHRGRRT